MTPDRAPTASADEARQQAASPLEAARPSGPDRASEAAWPHLALDSGDHDEHEAAAKAAARAETSCQLARLAPGTMLRDGLERVVRGGTGALVVLGDNRLVRECSSGGIQLDVEFSPTSLRELAKMDGAIILTEDLARIVRAGVHLVPPGDIPTPETGTRHRTADRLAVHAGVPTVTVSASMSTITLFLDGRRLLIERSDQVLARAGQAMATLERYRERLSRALAELTAHEVRSQVTWRRVLLVAQGLEEVRRLAAEVEAHVVALGVDGRLVRLRLAEHARSLSELPTILAADYAIDGRPLDLDALSELSDTELLDLTRVARAVGLADDCRSDEPVDPRGARLLRLSARTPPELIARVLDHFGSLQALLGAATGEIAEVEGMGADRARAVRAGLVRLADDPSRGGLD